MKFKSKKNIEYIYTLENLRFTIKLFVNFLIELSLNSWQSFSVRISATCSASVAYQCYDPVLFGNKFES